MPLIPIPNPVSGIGSAIADQVKDRFDEIVMSIVKAVVGAAASVFQMVVDGINRSTTPDLNASWFADGPLAKMLGVAGFLLAIMVVLGICHAVASGDPGAVVRRVLLELPGAVLSLTLLVTVTTFGIALTDALSAELMEGTAQPVKDFSGRMLGMVGRNFPLQTGMVFFWSALVLMIAALAVWVELLIRSSLIYLLVALSPLAIAARLWPVTRAMSARVTQYLAGFVLAKLIAALCLSIGLAAMANGGPTTVASAPAEPGSPGSAVIDEAAPSAQDRVDIGTILVGVALVGLAAFAPFKVISLMPIAENAGLQQGIKGSPGRAVTTAASTVTLAKTLKGG